jgi:hypothetical protein
MPAAFRFPSPLGDFNNDGIQDLAMAHRSSPGISVLLGNGNGTFRMPSNLDVGDRPGSIAVSDFDGDGNHDLAVASAFELAASPNVSVLLGNGNGTFQPAVNFIVTGDSHSLVVGQLSGDGRPDIAVAGSSRIARDRFYKVSVLINDTR